MAESRQMPDARPRPRRPAFPVMRWLALAWLCVWVPTYWVVWGWPNFLHICDVAVVLACIGWWRGDPLLLSSQAVSSLVASLAWSADVGGRLLLGRHPFGGTEFLWDAQVALWVRLLSLYHIVLPALLVWSLVRVGYDRRGLSYQCGIAAVLLVASRFLGPSLNLNFAFADPVFHRALGPGPVHLAAMFAGIIVLTYLPAHWALKKYLPRAGKPAQAA
jgi:hypothetical protein